MRNQFAAAVFLMGSAALEGQAPAQPNKQPPPAARSAPDASKTRVEVREYHSPMAIKKQFVRADYLNSIANESQTRYVLAYSYNSKGVAQGTETNITARIQAAAEKVSAKTGARFLVMPVDIATEAVNPAAPPPRMQRGQLVIPFVLVHTPNINIWKNGASFPGGEGDMSEKQLEKVIEAIVKATSPKMMLASDVSGNQIGRASCRERVSSPV